MKPKVTTKQILALNNLLNNLEDFNKRGLGQIKNVDVMLYVPQKTNIYVKYEKSYSNGGEMAYDFRIASISPSGEIDFIDEKFKNMFERSAFLSECIAFDIENPSEYEKID